MPRMPTDSDNECNQNLDQRESATRLWLGFDGNVVLGFICSVPL